MQNQILEQQLFDRWDTLPTILKEAIVSETNSLVAVKAAEGEHLSKEKIPAVLKLTGYVLMGFLHPEDTAREIQDALGINPNIAASIANTLNSRIFNPLRDELEKIYAPAIPETQQPVIVEEIKKPFDAAPSTSLGASHGKPGAPAAPTWPVNVPAKTVPEIKPPGFDSSTSLVSSKLTTSVAPKPEAVSVPLGPKIISTEIAPPTPSITPSSSIKNITQPPSPPAPSQPRQESWVKSSAFAEASADKQKSAMPAPFILHQESEFAPVTSPSGFKLEIPVPKFNETKSELEIPPKPAQIEIGPIIEMPKPPVSGQGSGVRGQDATPAAPPPVVSRVEPRVVHYSESLTPLVPNPPGQESRVMGQELKMPIPPKPPAASELKQAPTLMEINPPPPKPAERVIKKDYLPDPLKELELPKPSERK